MKKRKNPSSKSKYAQTTIFIILAIIIVLLIAIASYFAYLNKQGDLDRKFFSSTQIKPSLNSLELSILDCNEDISIQALNLIALQGGYYNKPSSQYLELGNIFIPYYYNQKTINYPSKQQVELELSNYVDDKLTNCINNINRQGFELIYKKPITTTSIKQDNVEFNTNLRITITKDNHNIDYQLSDHLISITSELSSILELAEFYTLSHSEDSEMYCITCISDMADKKQPILRSNPNQRSTYLNSNIRISHFSRTILI